MRIILTAFIILFFITIGKAQENCESDPIHQGEATYYGATGAGHCSYEASNDYMIGAMNHTDYNNSEACGACVAIQGPKGNINIKIVDECPECKVGDIDLSQKAFELIAPLIDG